MPSEHTLYIPCTYLELSLNIPLTYPGDSLKICPRFDQLSKTLPTDPPTWIKEMLAHLKALSKSQRALQLSGFAKVYALTSTKKIVSFLKWLFMNPYSRCLLCPRRTTCLSMSWTRVLFYSVTSSKVRIHVHSGWALGCIILVVSTQFCGNQWVCSCS